MSLWTVLASFTLSWQSPVSAAFESPGRSNILSTIASLHQGQYFNFSVQRKSCANLMEWFAQPRPRDIRFQQNSFAGIGGQDGRYRLSVR